MKAKKIMVVLTSMLMLVSAASCKMTTDDQNATAKVDETTANDATTASVTEATAEVVANTQPTKMSIILRGGTYAEVVKAALPTFEEQNNCQIEVLEMTFDDLHTGITLDAANQEGTYDLCMVDGSWMAEFTQNNVLTNLSDLGYSFDEDIIANTTDICTVGEDIYLAPYFGNVTVMLYNKANVEAAGYDPTKISTLADLLEVANTAKASGVNGFVYRGDTGDNIVSDFLPVLLAYGGWVVDENNQPTVNTPEFKEAMNYYLQLVQSGSAMAKDDVVAALDNGSATVAIGWPGWYVPSAESAANYMVSPASADANAAVYSTSEYGTWTLGVPANSPNSELGFKLLQYLMDPKVQLQSIENGGVPCRYSSLQDEEVLKEYPHLATVCDALENGVYRPVISQWTEFTNILGTEMGNVLANTKSVEEGLSSAQTQLESLMQ